MKKKRHGEIVKVSTLFEKYKAKFKPPQSSVIKEVIEVIDDITGIMLETNQIKYSVSTRVVSFQISSILKQEIKLYQNDLLVHLKARLGEHNEPTLIL